MAVMKFQRTFKLKPYWQDFKLKEDTDTKEIEIDGITYGFGGNSVLIPPDTVKKFINEDLSQIYHRDNLALKIFYKHPVLENMEMYELFWGNEAKKIIDSSIIQNIAAFSGLAPGVYDLVFLNFKDLKYVAQVTEFVENKEMEEAEFIQRVEAINEFSSKHEIIPENLSPTNFVGDKFTDFGRWYMDIYYREKLQEKIKVALRFGGSEEPYQSVENLHVKGQRSNIERYNILKKAFKKDSKLLPDNFTAVDFGCSGGFFLRRAFDWGAGYGVGVDTQEVINITSEVTFFFNYFNVDFYIELPDRKFDLGFYLSMDRHTDFEQFVSCINKILYLEGHSGDPKEKYMKMLKPHFKKVEYLGTVSDYGERHLFRAVR